MSCVDAAEKVRPAKHACGWGCLINERLQPDTLSSQVYRHRGGVAQGALLPGRLNRVQPKAVQTRTPYYTCRVPTIGALSTVPPLAMVTNKRTPESLLLALLLLRSKTGRSDCIPQTK